MASGVERICQYKDVRLELVGELPPEKVNKVTHVSIYIFEKVELLEGLPICEVRELPDKKTPIHYVAAPSLQKLFELHHRYGPDPKIVLDRSGCPYADKRIRARFKAIIPQPNPLIMYKFENKNYRKTIIAFFKHNTLTLQKQWRTIAESWIEEISTCDSIPIYNAVSRLVGRYLLEGTFGFTPCTEENVRTNYEFWHNLFSPKPSQMHTAEEHASHGGFGEQIGTIFGDFGEYCNKLKTVSIDKSGINKLAKKIIAYALSEEGLKNRNFPSYCLEAGFEYKSILGMVMTLMVATQETTTALLVAILYEYAKNPDMQDAHRKQLMDIKDFSDFNALKYLNISCYDAYLEALRLYAPGGVQREAAHDMIIHYDEGHEHYIRKGDFIAPYPILQGRNRLVWQDPLKFNPERGDLTKIKEEIVPFGSGAHRCPGERTAETQIMLTLALLLPKVQLQYNEEMPPLIEATVIRPVKDFLVTIGPLDKV